MGRLNEAEQTGAEAVICACPTCNNNFCSTVDEQGSKLEVLDVSDLVVESMGLPVLVVKRLNRLVKNRFKQRVKRQPEILLTEAELVREKNLFRPHALSSASLKPRIKDIRELSEKMAASGVKPPSGC